MFLFCFVLGNGWLGVSRYDASIFSEVLFVLFFQGLEGSQIDVCMCVWVRFPWGGTVAGSCLRY